MTDVCGGDDSRARSNGGGGPSKNGFCMPGGPVYAATGIAAVVVVAAG